MMPPFQAPTDDAEAEATPLHHVLMHAFLNNVPDFVYFKDRESRFIAVSRSQAGRLGLDPTELIGKSDADFFTDEHAQWARADEESIVNTGEPILGKHEQITWPGGRKTWVEASKLPLRDTGGEIVGTFGVSRDVTRELEMQAQLEQTQHNLVGASHLAGMAEVATGVLHNVGNVLTSVNVSASVIAAGLQQSKTESLAKLASLLREHEADLGEFIAHDPKGRRVPEFLESLARHALEERQKLLEEIASLQQNIDHIKEIVSMQQTYATLVGVVESLDPAILMDDAIRMNAGAFVRHDISVVREFHPVPSIVGEKAKILQILVNLIRNAKFACDESGAVDKIITLRVEPAPENGVRLIVQDNGVGIAPENMGRLFEHGFTTRRHGHGFGLHSAIKAARDLKGTLSAHSAGRGHGATFTLELPLAAEPSQMA